MIFKNIRQVMCVALTLMLLAPAALAQSPSDDVSGYNPFDPDSANEAETQPDDLFSGNNAVVTPVVTLAPATNGLAGATGDPFAMGTTNAGTDPFATGTNNTGADPFATGTTNTAADPFGMGATGAGTNTEAANSIADDFFGGQVTPTAVPGAAGSFIDMSGGVTGAQTPAVTSTMMFVIEESVKVRFRPADNGKIMLTAGYGQQLTVTATQGEWAQVQNEKGQTGYAPLSALSTANPNTMNKVMYAQLNTVPMYRTPSQKAGRVRNLRKGDTVTMVAITTDGKWARVSDGSNFGYTPSIYLDDAPSAEGTQVWCVAGSTAVMVNPDNWIQLSTLSFGQGVWLVGYVNNNAIAKIRSAKGYVAFCDASALTTVDPANLNLAVYVQAAGKVLSTGTDAAAKSFNVNKNARLTLLGVDNSQYWALVRQGKRKLYIPYIFLGNERPGQNNRVVVVNQDTPLYQSNEQGAAVLGTLPMGTRMNLVGGEGGYAKVATISDGFTQPVTGFVELQYLRGE